VKHEPGNKSAGAVSSVPVSASRGFDVPSWHLLPPVPPLARVLYLGMAGGDVAAQLALSFGPLLIIEPSLGRAAATRAHSGLVAAGPVLTICGDLRLLPLRPASLDLAVLDLHLEHPGPQLGPPAPASLLASLRSGLKPGGFLCLRLHEQPAETPEAGRRRSRVGMLLFLGRFRRLLRDSAYGDIRVWCAYPDCADPKFIVESKQPVFDYFVHHFGRNPKSRLRAAAERLFNAAGLLKYAAPGYLLLARRPLTIQP
jgi:SAM-dependent methyltransferase